MIRVHKIALDPNASQRAHFAHACGVARFSYNWALAEWQRQYEAGEKPSEGALRRKLNSLKKSEFPWMLDVTKSAPQQAIKNLGNAYTRFFKRLGGRPKFKKRGVSKDSFRADNGPGTVKVEGRKIRIPRLGWVRMREEPRFAGEPRSVTISRKADRWFATISYEVEERSLSGESQATCGVDLGLRTMAVVSDGTEYNGPKALSRNLKKLKRLSRSLSRKKKGSANRAKAKARIAKLHAHISNVRSDALHKATTDICRRFGVVVLEDLNVRGMQANRCLARAVSDVGMYEFRRQVEYKADHVLFADRWYPSSKTCSDCGTVNKEVVLGVSEWTCSDCGSVHDRDLNAARNLKKLAASYAVTACGAEGLCGGSHDLPQVAAAKQEPELEQAA